MAELDFKKVPVWGWIGGGLAAAYIIYTRKSSSASTSTDTSSTDTGNNAPIEILSPSGGTTTQTYSTDQEWATAAINWLIAQGYSPALANSAITKGINGGYDTSGNGMSASEYSLWSLALQQLGSPPQPVSVSPPSQAPGTPSPTPSPNPSPSPSPSPSPTPKPGPKPSVRYATVKPWPAKQSTLSGLAQQYYGNAADWPRIYNANKKGVRRADGSKGMISNPNLIMPGWKLIIP